MSKIRSYKTYFRSPTGRGGFKLPRRTTHRILEKVNFIVEIKLFQHIFCNFNVVLLIMKKNIYSL